MRTNMHNMATTHPHLLRWFASPNPRMVLLKLLPLIALYGYFLIKPNFPFWSIPVYFGLGIITWSFFEYATHRWVYHIHFKNKKLKWLLEAFHLYHHHNLKDYRVLNAGFLLIYPIAISFWLVVFLFTGQAYTASLFGLGTLTYYFFYENVHYYIHYKKYDKGYMHMIQKYHLYHHYKKWNVNYGNTVTVWDRLLGTYDNGYKDLTLSANESKDFIRYKQSSKL